MSATHCPDGIPIADGVVCADCAGEKAALAGVDPNTTSEPPTYRIETVRDFLHVPPDRRDDCLHEFAVWLACDDLLKSIAKDAGARATLPRAFEWIDDGKGEVCAMFSAGKERIVVIDGVIKERGA